MQEQTYDTNIEATLLSSLIFNPALLDKHALHLSPTLFFLPTHKKIVELILDLHKNGKVIDEEILRNRLGSEYESDLIYILTKNPLGNIEDYLEILQDYAIKREMQKLSLEIQNSLQSNIKGIELQAKVLSLTEELSTRTKKDIFEINNIESIEEKEVEFICKNWLPIPVRTVSLITAPGGTGKSWLTLQLAIRAIEEGRVERAFLWLSEDPKEISKNRFNKIFTKVVRCKNENIKKKIDISDSPTIQFLYEDQRRVEVSPLFAHFKIKLQPYDLIILDPLIAFYGTDENNNSSARRFMQLFTDWANKENKTIIFIHHSTKNTTQSRGASAFVDAVRTVYEIDKIKDKEGNETQKHKRIIKLTKDNYGISNLLEGFSVERELFPYKVKVQEVVYESKEKLFGVPADF